ncbi:ferroxidase fet3, partial [Coemansia sp. RSA 2703]
TNRTVGRTLQPADFGRRCNAKILHHLAAVELRVFNTDNVFHPMHLHGHFFQIVERGAIGDPKSVRRATGPPMRRDTVLIGPGQYAVLRFVADNPGVWLMHCHIERHMELGLSMLFVSAPDVMRERLAMPAPQNDIALDLAGMVVITGPRSALPATRELRRVPPNAVPRPLVEVHDAAERLYARNGLPLFEVLDQRDAASDASDAEQRAKEGPVAAVLRRRSRRQSTRVAPVKSAASDQPSEDLSDAYYRRLHRRPEYLEKRIRNRELELYQYAAWRESQRRRAAKPSEPASATDVQPDTPTQRDASDAGDVKKANSGNARSIRSNELKALADSPGFAKAQEKATVAPPSQPAAVSEPIAGYSELSPAERRTARLAGCVLEQLLAHAARLPPADAIDYDDAHDDTTAFCCPREFALPPRLFGHMMRQRELKD